jgi:glycerol-3-phosphate acyltransferase PlsY
MIYEIMAMSLGMGVVAYLIGSISPSILLAKSKGIDIRQEGSGNAGTTNTLRVLGKQAAAITLILDILKGVAAVLLGTFVMSNFGEFPAAQTSYLCVVGVTLGHIYPLYFKFKGGKGIATAFGALTAMNPLLGLSALGVVALGTLISRRMSVGSLLGAMALPFLTMYFEMNFMFGAFFLGAITIYKHWPNIARLRAGTEPKISFGSKKN